MTRNNKGKGKTAGGSRESFLIFMVVACGIVFTLSLLDPKAPSPNASSSKEGGPSLKSAKTEKAAPAKVALIDVPLATGKEPIDKLFVQSGCAVCHTIPGIAPAKGRQGPRLVLGTNAPIRLADPQYKGGATSVREYIQESILNPGAYIVPGYSDRVMPRWYGKRLNAQAVDRIVSYLERITE